MIHHRTALILTLLAASLPLLIGPAGALASDTAACVVRATDAVGMMIDYIGTKGEAGNFRRELISELALTPKKNGGKYGFAPKDAARLRKLYREFTEAYGGDKGLDAFVQLYLEYPHPAKLLADLGPKVVRGLQDKLSPDAFTETTARLIEVYESYRDKNGNPNPEGFKRLLAQFGSDEVQAAQAFDSSYSMIEEPRVPKLKALIQPRGEQKAAQLLQLFLDVNKFKEADQRMSLDELSEKMAEIKAANLEMNGVPIGDSPAVIRRLIEFAARSKSKKKSILSVFKNYQPETITSYIKKGGSRGDSVLDTEEVLGRSYLSKKSQTPIRFKQGDPTKPVFELALDEEGPNAPRFTLFESSLNHILNGHTWENFSFLDWRAGNERTKTTLSLFPPGISTAEILAQLEFGLRLFLKEHDEKRPHLPEGDIQYIFSFGINNEIQKYVIRLRPIGPPSENHYEIGTFFPLFIPNTQAIHPETIDRLDLEFASDPAQAFRYEDLRGRRPDLVSDEPQHPR